MDRLHDPYNTLTPTLSRIVGIIHDADDWVDTRAVAAATSVTVSHANRVLNMLADAGTITRRRSPRVNRGIPAHQWRCEH